MAKTTFNGPVRSEKGFQMVSKNATTGTVTVTSGDKWSCLLYTSPSPRDG